jgi:hypothetical protein
MTIITITDTDLINNKNFYDIDILEFNIKNLNKKILLSTQKLTPEFCIKYILDMDIDSGSEDSYIYDIDYILYFQKHITHEEMSRMFIEIN